MKRLLIGALAVLMVCSLSIVGFAQTLDQDNPTGAVTIRTTYGEEDIKYAIQIPADTEIPWTAEKTSLAYVPTLMQLEAGKKVVVTVAGEHNALRLDSAQRTMQLPYQLSGAVTADFYGRQVGEAYAKEFVVNIAAAAWDAVDAGHYTDRVLFTMSYVDA